MQHVGAGARGPGAPTCQQLPKPRVMQATQHICSTRSVLYSVAVYNATVPCFAAADNMLGHVCHTQNATWRTRPTRRVSHVAHVATPSKPPASRLAKRSKVEIIKEQSDFLRHPLMADLVDERTFISEESMQLMKFHGSYQQDHREKRAFGQGKFYQFMMRTRQPGGVVTNQLYLAMDDLADMVCP